MSEKTAASAEKKTEVKSENSASPQQKSDSSQFFGSSVDRILFLQRTIGNQAVGRLIKSGALQAKLRIVQPRDIYEQEDDNVDENADVQRNVSDSEMQSTAAQIEQNQQQKMDFIGQMEQSDVVQRTPEPIAGVDQNEAMIHAVNMVNKNSMLKIKLPVKAPPGRKLFGGLELKKIELELDVLGEVSAPGLANNKSTTKVAVGAQNVGQSEADPTKRAANEAQGTIYALEMEQKFGSSPFEEIFSIKPGVEYGSYTAANALTPNKQEFKGKVGFQIAAEGFAIEVQFIPIAYDKTKTVRMPSSWALLRPRSPRNLSTICRA
jgi:hypothetical protein